MWQVIEKFTILIHFFVFKKLENNIVTDLYYDLQDIKSFTNLTLAQNSKSSHCDSVCIVISLRIGWPENRVSIAWEGIKFYLGYCVHTGSGTHTGALSPGEKRPKLEMTTHLTLIPVQRIPGATPAFPHTSSWCDA
jgi:hypothetical protein